jgi:hypothetical protein
MDVIGHEHVRVYGAVFLQADLSQLVEVSNPVNVREEARLAIIPALDHALRHSWKVDPWSTGHGVDFDLSCPMLSPARRRVDRRLPSQHVGKIRNCTPTLVYDPCFLFLFSCFYSGQCVASLRHGRYDLRKYSRPTRGKA